MKQWIFPQITVEGFAANEYVATCSSAGGSNIQLDCDATPGQLDAPVTAQLTHKAISNDCSETIILPASTVAKLGTKQKFVSDEGYYDSRIPDGYHGNMYWATKYRANDGSDRYVIVWQSVLWNGRVYSTPMGGNTYQHWIFTDGKSDSNPTS